MRDVGTMPKTGQNQSQNYRFIEQALMMAVLRPLFVEHGIVILPEILGTDWHRPEGAKQTTARCQMRFTLINADNPAEKVECLWSSEGADMGDKGVNKAGTSGEKYFLMKLFMLSDKDEPDADAVPDMPRPPAQRPSQPARQEPTPIRRSAGPKEGDPAPADWRDKLLSLAEELHALNGTETITPERLLAGDARNRKARLIEAIDAAKAKQAAQ